MRKMITICLLFVFVGIAVAGGKKKGHENPRNPHVTGTAAIQVIQQKAAVFKNVGKQAINAVKPSAKPVKSATMNARPTVKTSGLDVVMNRGGKQMNLQRLNKHSNVFFTADVLEMPYPIGAKGPNPVHGSKPSQEAGNPGGGNGKGNWGKGNQGNGKGNIWTGNQGRGRGAGMAGYREEPEPEPEPKPKPKAPAAPLPKLRWPGLEECPVLAQFLNAELGISEDEQGHISGFAISSWPTSCELAQELLDTVGILRKGLTNEQIKALTEFAVELMKYPPIPEIFPRILVEHEGNSDLEIALQYLDYASAFIWIIERDLLIQIDATELVLEKYCYQIIETSSDPETLGDFILFYIQAEEVLVYPD